MRIAQGCKMNVCGPGSQLREAKGVWPYLLLISDPAQRL